MTDDPMKAAADVFSVLDRFRTPDGWIVIADAGWPDRLFEPATQYVAGPKRDGESLTVDWDGRPFPRYFSLSVLRLDPGPGRSTPGDPHLFTTMLMSMNDEHLVTLNGVTALGEDVDRRLAAILRLHTLDWWKTKALIEVGAPSESEIQRLHQAGASMLEVLARPAGTSQLRRNNRITTALLQEVADVYRAALADGRPPTVAVEKHFPTTRANAAKWVARARAEKLLGPAVGPTAGEGPLNE